MDTNTDDRFVKITVRDQTFECGKSSLEQHSDYFRAMFSSNMTECSTNTVTLHDVSASAFSTLLDYTKTHIIPLNSENVMDILESACMFQFNKVIQLCEIFVIKNMTCDNSLVAMTFARSHGIERMYQIAKKTALWSASKVVVTEQIQCLSYGDLKDFLGHSLLNVHDEFEVLQGITLWMQEQKEAEIDDMNMFDLLNCIQLTNLNCSQISELLSHPLCLQCKEFMQKMQMIMQSQEQNTMQAKKRKLPERLCILKNEGFQLMLTESGEILSPGSHLCALSVNRETEEASIAEWSKAPWEGRKNGPIGYRACVIGCCVYVFGGELSLGTGRWIDDVWEFDTLKCLWRSVCPLPSPRRHHGLAVHENHVYMTGGFGRHRILLNTVLRFSLSSRVFEELEPLPSTMYNCSSLVHDNRLYVFKSDILCLDLTKPCQWSTYPLPAQIDHPITSAFTYRDRIYLGFPNDKGQLCKVNLETMDCCLTGSFGRYKIASIQNVVENEENQTVEEKVTLLGEREMRILGEETGELCVERTMGLTGLENVLEMCLLRVPNYTSV